MALTPDAERGARTHAASRAWQKARCLTQGIVVAVCDGQPSRTNEQDEGDLLA